MTGSEPIPMTVIGGFLGAGKTTFLNRLLANATERYAVLVNDFGEINIDAALIARHDGTTLSLTNGCVCCSIGSGFPETLGALLDGGGRFDRVVIEASGVGDPWRIAEIALVEPDLRLDGVILLADATRIAQLVDDRRVGDTVRNQFDKCNLVLLTKSDLATEQQLRLAHNTVRSLRPGVRIELGSRGASADIFSQSGPRSRFQASEADPLDLRHEEQFRRWTYRRDGAFDRQRLAAAIDALPSQLLRLKGGCRVSDDGTPLLLQMVSKDWSLSPADGTIDPQSIALVGIGTTDLPSDRDLEAILDSALA